MRTVEIKKKARSILGVSDDADITIIRSAYKELAKKYHPDRNPDDKNLEARFKLITEAYEILCGEKNTGRHSILQSYSENVNRPVYNDKSYSEWWMERFGALF